MEEWNLKLLYPTKEAFEQSLEEIKEIIKKLEGLKGKLGSLEGFSMYAEYNRILDLKLSRAYSYVSMKYDLNQKDISSGADYQKVFKIYNDMLVQTAFIKPEIISYGKPHIMRLVEELGLKEYQFEMENLFRNQEHFLDAKSENIMANYSSAIATFHELYDKLAVSDNASTEILLSNGKKIEVSEADFTYYLGILEDAKDRQKVFEAIYRFYENHKNTFATIYNGIMQAELAEVKNRGYSSILESHLFYNAIPVDVYHSLVETTRRNTKVLKEYLAFRQKYFKLDKLHTYDRFLQFSHSQKEYSYEKSKEMVLDACRTLGEDYYNHACKALEDGRVSVYTKDGKRTGAYSTSLYDCGAFILLNHNNNLDSAFTIAHEAGHSIHSLYANENQAPETANYTIFVAEIASTFNEQLFLDYVMAHSTNKEEKIVVLQQALDNIVATFYRQTLFADYELRAHELVEKGIPVTQESLANIMTELYDVYYGINLKEEPLKNNVWAYIPHFFHTPFYVYQYATSFAASLAIYEKVKNKESNALENYIKMLSLGGSTYPIDIVKQASVDLTQEDAFIAVIHRFEELLKDLKKMLGE